MYGKSVKAGSYMSRTYQIIRELGAGGSGAVYMAWHKRLRKYVVIKVVKNNSTRKIEVRRNEVEALKNIKNEFIPQVLDFLAENDHSFTILEYIEGESFDKLLPPAYRFTEAQIIKWYVQLASALDAIHMMDVCHRDIKPANIMLTIKGDVCLIDFNSAMVSGNITGVTSRSMGYASPEQYEYFKLCKNMLEDSDKVSAAYAETALKTGDCKTVPIPVESITKYQRSEKIDWKRSDIYSLGATMLHFLTGKRPPVRTDEIRRISQIEGYSKAILKIIEISMKRNPYERFTSAKALTDALQRL